MSLCEAKQPHSSNSVLWGKHLRYRATSGKQLLWGEVVPPTKREPVFFSEGRNWPEMWGRPGAWEEERHPGGGREAQQQGQWTCGLPLAGSEPETGAWLEQRLGVGWERMGLKPTERIAVDLFGPRTTPKGTDALSFPTRSAPVCSLPQRAGESGKLCRHASTTPLFPTPRLRPSRQADPTPDWRGGSGDGEVSGKNADWPRTASQHTYGPRQDGA